MAPPDRWMDYSPMGEKISGTRFICMKVPLKPHLSRYIDEKDKFSCDTAVEMARSKGYNLGLVIDLSFTKRYYDPDDFESKNIKYKKIFVPGRVIPEKSVLDSFTETVARFEEENADNENLIAVHCTHGLNRTGYMICRHLIDQKNLDSEDAIQKFETARGYKIEREVYLNDLRGNTTIKPPLKQDHHNIGQKNLPADRWEHNINEFMHDFRHNRGLNPYYQQAHPPDGYYQNWSNNHGPIRHYGSYGQESDWHGAFRHTGFQSNNNYPRQHHQPQNFYDGQNDYYYYNDHHRPGSQRTNHHTHRFNPCMPDPSWRARSPR